MQDTQSGSKRFVPVVWVHEHAEACRLYHFCGPCSPTSETTFASSSAVHGPLTNFGSSTFCQLDERTIDNQHEAVQRKKVGE